MGGRLHKFVVAPDCASDSGLGLAGSGQPDHGNGTGKPVTHATKSRPGSSPGQAFPENALRAVNRLTGAYFSHFHATSPLLAGLVQVSSSPAVSEVMVRFCTVPSKFGNVLPSTRSVRVLSASLRV
jgi:hypothetical protein